MNVKTLLLSLCALCHFQIHAMTIDRVILATNNDATYIEFWPLVAPIWSELGIRPTLALIAHPGVVVDESLGDVIRFDPIPGVSQATQAQAIRLLLPAYFPDEVCIISDIDMMPLNKDYFHQSVADIADDAFVVFKDRAYSSDMKQYPMCYNVAKGSTWAKIFKVKNVRHIQSIMQGWCALGLGWNTDERILWKSLHQWDQKDQSLVLLGHTVERRLDRSDWTLERLLIEDYYIDCHMPRPYSDYRDEIKLVVDTYFPQ